MKKGGIMKRAFRVSFSIILILAVILIPVSAVFASPINKTSVIQLTNKVRIDAGLPILWSNFKLNLAAQNKANDMMTKGYWDHYHNGKTPWDWMKEAGYEFNAAGENLAIDFVEVEPMMKAWMDSPTHRQNILNPNFREIGIGVAKGYFQDHETIIVVQMFGNPKAGISDYSSQVAGTNGADELINQSIESPQPEKQDKAGFFQNIFNEIRTLFYLIGAFILELLHIA